MQHTTERLTLTLALAIALCGSAIAGTITFETINEFTLASEAYALAGDNGGNFTVDDAALAGYHYTDPWDYWGGFAASNRTVIAPDDTYHQYTATPGGDATIGAGGTYAIGYEDFESPIGTAITFATPQDIDGAWLTNIAWTTEYITGNYGLDDTYTLTVTAYDAALSPLDSTAIDLTDVADWQWFDFGFQNVTALGFTMAATDSWTPSYFAIDDIAATPVPEPATLATLAIGGLVALRRRR